jgi:hypothetical protein
MAASARSEAALLAPERDGLMTGSGSARVRAVSPGTRHPKFLGGSEKKRRFAFRW